MEKKFGKICRMLALFLLAGSTATLAACSKTEATEKKTTANSSVTTADVSSSEGDKTTGGNTSTEIITTIEEVDEIELDKETLAIECYLTGAINATSNRNVVWTSSNEDVAIVNENGVVTALSVGEATITATAGTASATCLVSVTESTVEPVVGANEESITIKESNQSFTLNAETYWGGNQITEGVSYEWSIKEGEDASCITIDANADEAIVTGKKTGETVIVLASTVRGKTAYSEIEVTVIQDDIIVSLENEDEFIQSEEENVDYYIELALTEGEGKITSIEPIVEAKFGGKKVEVTKTYETSTDDIIKIEGNTIEALKAGTTLITITSTYADELVGSKSATIVLKVEVVRGIVKLNDVFTIENTNIQNLTLSNDIEGEVNDIVLCGKSILEDYTDKVITLKAENIPVKAFDANGNATMGDGLIASILTDSIEYQFTINLYTKILTTKADIDKMGELAAAASNDALADIPTTWNGYFVLGNNIDYNGEYLSMFGKGNIWNGNGDYNAKGKRGFAGVFDGKGYTINGMTITKNTYQNQTWGFIPQMLETGMIKNVAFTNARAIETDFLCSCFEGKIENVYIQFAELTAGTFKTGAGDFAAAGGVCGNYNNGENAYVKNCVFDCSKAVITGDAAMVVMGHTWSPSYTIENVYIISSKNNDNGVTVPDYETLKADTTIQEALANFSNIWTINNGIPVMKSVISTNGIAITNEPANEYKVGEEFTVTFNSYLVDVVILKKDGTASALSFANGKVVIGDSSEFAGEYVLKASNPFNANDFIEFEFAVEFVQNSTLSREIDFNFGTDGTASLTNVVFDLSEVASDLGTIKSIKIGEEEVRANCTLEGSTLTMPIALFNNGKMYGDVVIKIETENGSSKYNTIVNALLITKSITNKADLDNMGTIAKAFSGDGKTWDGYFVLTANIDYNGAFDGMFGAKNNWMKDNDISNVNTRGFKGVFDGRGHIIDGMTIDDHGENGCGYGFIPTMKANAVMKNIVFTNAIVIDVPFLSSYMAAGATYENIYIQYKKFILNEGTPNTTGVGTFPMNGHKTDNAKYIFIDARNCEETLKGTTDWTQYRLLSRKAGEGSFLDPYCLGIANELFDNGSGKLTTGEHTNYIPLSEEAFKNGERYQNAIATWPTDFWDISSKIPVPKALLD